MELEVRDLLSTYEFPGDDTPVHGRVSNGGLPDGSNMPDKHREAFKECIGMGYRQFDAAWREWALLQ